LVAGGSIGVDELRREPFCDPPRVLPLRVPVLRRDSEERVSEARRMAVEPSSPARRAASRSWSGR
jgi:hypothetical protein